MEEPITSADDYAGNRQLALVDAVTPISHSITPLAADHSNPGSPKNKITTSKFTLPKGWKVKKVPRKFSGSIDKYYIEPETGQQFRSLKEVERYVNDGVTPPTTRVKRLKCYDDEKVENHTTEAAIQTRTRGKRVKYHHDGKVLELEDNKDGQFELAIVSTPPSPPPPPPPPFKLPDGWIVEEVPRRNGGSADKYYYEQGTGQKFRSLLAVERYVTQMEENLPLSAVLEEIREKNLPLSKAFKLSSPIKSCGSYNSWKKSTMSIKEKTCLPSKVNWVIGEDDAWNAYLDQTLVPDSVKQQWGNTFFMSINDATGSG
ncbi:methyl-CpG-binding domain-containing protein 7-like [Bidens hawaiensis]|uniref:methyl-CpG-binding domain-containing protein 7-like n=1 Tax=Bidens hawaiensis TaxID=980011 RepID=UPI00404AA2AA